MNFSAAFVLAVSMVAIVVGVSADGDPNQPRICTNLKVADNGCIRYVQGFDITGVVTEVDLTFPTVTSKCECIQQCLNRPDTCATWVYKFSTPESLASGHRTCTLYSQFNLPSNVTIFIDLNSNKNVNINAAEIKRIGNNPQMGSAVPGAFKDAMLNTTIDNAAFSGPVWQLSNGKVLC